VEKHKGEEWRLVDVSNYPLFDVYRLPQLHQEEDALQGSHLHSAIRDIAAEWTGFQYPPLRRLARASPLFENFPGAKRLLGDIIDLYYRIWFKLPGIVAPGPFRSDLVVRAFGKLEVSRPECAILKVQRGSRSVSPADLGDSGISALEHRSEFVVTEDPDSPDFRTKLPAPRAKRVLDMEEKTARNVLFLQTELWKCVPKFSVLKRSVRKFRSPGS
jgi:hypothetical protein